MLTGGTKEYNGYNVANQGDRVTLKVSAEDGYYIEGAFNGLGERVPLRFENGVYYIDVPMGGGVYLSVKVGKREDADGGDSSESSATRIDSTDDGWVDLSTENSKNRVVIPWVKSQIKGNERNTLAALSPMQQMLVVLIKAGYEDAVSASGFKLTAEARRVVEQIKEDLRGAVKIQYRWENNVKENGM